MTRAIEVMHLAEFLGLSISQLLESRPFTEFSFQRTVETKLPRIEVWYEFEGRHVDVICDEDETIRTIFLYANADQELCEIPFGASRSSVTDLLGEPVDHGGPIDHAVLGRSGSWDRYVYDDAAIHVQYEFGADRSHIVTLMRLDAIPVG